MGWGWFGERMSSAAERVKENSPSLSTVKTAASATYDAGSKAAVAAIKGACSTTHSVGSNVVNAVKDKGPQVVKNTTPYVTHPATREIVKYLLPGATPAVHIAGALLKDKTNNNAHSILSEKKSELLSEQLKLIQAENELLKAELELHKSECFSVAQTRRASTITSQKPEDVIRIFMMKGFNIQDFTANQIVPIQQGKFIVCDQEEGKP